MLFQLLRALTGSFWRCAAVAALFAVHPVQVESVAWVAERKTVLAALLGLLASRAYLRHVARPAARSLRRGGPVLPSGCSPSRCWSSCPLLLLLLDWWPLGRFGRRGAAPGEARRPVVEKAPLFALALLSGVVTIAAQSRVGAVASLQVFPLPVRLGNALLSCVAYLGDLFLPRDLTVFYPHPAENLPWGRVGLAALALAAVTFAALRARRAAPYATFGWLWYLVALLPVIGIIQVGQPGARRPLPLPPAGRHLPGRRLGRRRPRAAIAALQGPGGARDRGGRRSARPGRPPAGGYWRDSGTLWEHALAVDPESETALYQLSEHYRDLGRFPDQAALLRRLVQLNPRHERALNNLGIARYQLGEKPEALLADYRRSWPSTRGTPRPCRTTAIC